jgi:hypothetical protein
VDLLPKDVVMFSQPACLVTEAWSSIIIPPTKSFYVCIIHINPIKTLKTHLLFI